MTFMKGNGRAIENALVFSFTGLMADIDFAGSVISAASRPFDFLLSITGSLSPWVVIESAFGARYDSLRLGDHIMGHVQPATKSNRRKNIHLIITVT